MIREQLGQDSPNTTVLVIGPENNDRQKHLQRKQWTLILNTIESYLISAQLN